MKVIFDKSFSKSIEKLGNKQIKDKIKDSIIKLENSTLLEEIPTIKKLSGHKSFYRIKIGDYRIGFELEDMCIRLITVAHRKDIYKRFP